MLKSIPTLGVALLAMMWLSADAHGQ